MRSKDSTKHSRDDKFHLSSILLVIVISLLAWGVEYLSTPDSTSSSKDLLLFLNAIPHEEGAPGMSRLKPPPSSVSVYDSSISIEPSPKVILSKNYKYTFERTHKKTLTPSSRSINLNTIDSLALETLPVFGPVLSARTTKFRDALGGFVEVRQLQDVYGFDAEDFDKVKNWFFIDEQDVTPLCINNATWEQMRDHPYIGFDGATIIDRYRRHNKLHSTEQLWSLPNLSDSTRSRWEPYIKICSID